MTSLLRTIGRALARFFGVWLQLLSLHWLTGPDRLISFTKLTVVALYAWVLPQLTPALSWTFIATVVLLALIPFGLKGLTAFMSSYAVRPPAPDVGPPATEGDPADGGAS